MGDAEEEGVADIERMRARFRDGGGVGHRQNQGQREDEEDDRGDEEIIEDGCAADGGAVMARREKSEQRVGGEKQERVDGPLHVALQEKEARDGAKCEGRGARGPRENAVERVEKPGRPRHGVGDHDPARRDNEHEGIEHPGESAERGEVRADAARAEPEVGADEAEREVDGREPFDDRAEVAGRARERGGEVDRRVEHGGLALLDERLAAVLEIIDFGEAASLREHAKIVRIGADEPGGIVVVQEEAGARDFHAGEQQPKRDDGEEKRRCCGAANALGEIGAGVRECHRPSILHSAPHKERPGLISSNQ